MLVIWYNTFECLYICINAIPYVREQVIQTSMDGRMDGWTDGRMDGWTDGRMDGWTDGRMDGWMDGRMDGRTDGWMDGCTFITVAFAE